MKSVGKVKIVTRRFLVDRTFVIGVGTMKDFYKVLDLPKDASEEQVKAQFKLLVRVYHPDRFNKPEDKLYAEQKIKEINEAYSTLVKPAPETTSSTKEEQPVPVAIPAYIDFGILAHGDKKIVTLAVSNARGEVNDLQFDFSDTRWFTLNESKLLTDSRTPLQFEVVANTSELAPGRTYKGWIDVRMKSSVTRVNLSMRLAGDSAVWDVGSIARTALLGMALTAITASAAYFGPRYLGSTPQGIDESSASITTNERLDTTSMEVASASTGTGTSTLRGHNPLLQSLVSSNASTNASSTMQMLTPGDRLVYPVLDGSSLKLYTSLFDGSEQQEFSFAGQNISWSPDGTRIAYILRVQGIPQIFVAQSAERTGDALTNSTAPKSDLTWSSDSSQIAYVQFEDGQHVLYVISPTGGRPRALSNPRNGSVGHYTWAPDSRMLVFDIMSGDTRMLYRVNADGSDLQPFGTSNAFDPAWSPDGSSVIVATDYGVVAIDRNGKELRKLSNKPARSPRWSPDGGQFAFLTSSQPNDVMVDLVSTDLSGRKSTLLARGDIANFAWSPESDKIAYVTGKVATKGTSILYLWNITLGEKPKLVAETNDPFVTWVP